MPTKWDYKVVARSRGWGKDKSAENAPWQMAGAWNVDMEKMLPTLGDEGWELVAITTRSGYLGGDSYSSNSPSSSSVSKDFAGFTSNEIWVFKRPRD